MSHRTRLFLRAGMSVLVLMMLAQTVPGSVIHVVDDATGRGVPLVRLKTVDNRVFYTDSGGYAAVMDQDLWGETVYFHIESDGYEFPADGFGYRGQAIPIGLNDQDRPHETEIRLKRTNIAERLYRITGAGIYADALLAGRSAPLKQPLLNAKVVGQDSVQAAVLGDKIQWFWGDTLRVGYPLGNFGTAAAVSALPGKGGLPPIEGIDLEYYTDENGFARETFDRDSPGPIWLDGVMVVEDESGRPRIVGHYAKMKDLGTRLAHGMAVFDAEAGTFERLREFPNDAPLFAQGQAFPVTDADGVKWIYFANPYPAVRVRAKWNHVLDAARYESWTPFPPGTKSQQEGLAEGKSLVEYAWRPGTAYLDPEGHIELAKQDDPGVEPWFITRDAESGEAIRLHGGSVRWNPYRQAWVLVAVQLFGSNSLLGEMWYAEGNAPHGPFPKAVKIATHTNYSLYNPVHHDFFDESDGRYIYFQGTYSSTFEDQPVPTPKYDYNQLMYRLDLADERLMPARIDDASAGGK